MKTDMILDAMNEIDDEFLIISDKKRRRFSPKPLIIAATIALLFNITTPVLAAENEMVYNIMYALSPEIAQKMKPQIVINKTEEQIHTFCLRSRSII